MPDHSLPLLWSNLSCIRHVYLVVESAVAEVIAVSVFLEKLVHDCNSCRLIIERSVVHNLNTQTLIYRQELGFGAVQFLLLIWRDYSAAESLTSFASRAKGFFSLSASITSSAAITKNSQNASPLRSSKRLPYSACPKGVAHYSKQSGRAGLAQRIKRQCKSQNSVAEQRYNLTHYHHYKITILHITKSSLFTYLNSIMP